MTEPKTVHQLTLDFNSLAEQARERGVAAWAKHHSSDFSSRAVADTQLARLRREMTEDAPVPDVLRQTRPHTVVVHLPGSTVRHLSMAPDWVRAVDLAMRAVRGDRLVPLDQIPNSITVEEG